MLWGAPLCFISQARPVKIWSKQLFFMCSYPPGIVLSLLPAPQQAILNMDLDKSYTALYAPEEHVVTKKRALREALPEAEEEVVEEDEVVEDVEDESESEQEESSDDQDEYDLED